MICNKADKVIHGRSLAHFSHSGAARRARGGIWCELGWGWLAHTGEKETRAVKQIMQICWLWLVNGHQTLMNLLSPFGGIDCHFIHENCSQRMWWWLSVFMKSWSSKCHVAFDFVSCQIESFCRGRARQPNYRLWSALLLLSRLEAWIHSKIKWFNCFYYQSKQNFNKRKEKYYHHKF